VTIKPIRSCWAITLISAMLCGAAARPALAQTKDVTLDNAEGLLSLALSETKDAPVMQGRNAAAIFTALRISRDVAVLPLFDRLRDSKFTENQIFGMVATAILTKDTSKVDAGLLVNTSDPSMVGSAIASLIDAGVISNEQLQRLVTDAPDPAHRVMAAGELNKRKILKDRTVLKMLLASSKDMVRHYAAATMLEQKDDGENDAALKALNDMATRHDLRTAPVQAMILVKAQKENLVLMTPWVTLIARDEENDEGLRLTAVSTLLTLKGPDGPQVFTDMVQKQKEPIQQVKLGLIALENADRLKPAQMEPLERSKSALARTIAGIARKAAEGGDVTNDLVRLIREGHPILLNWAVVYSDRCDPDRKLALRTAIVAQASIVDEVRGGDFERAALAAQKLLDDPSPDSRKAVQTLVKSENRAVVEATLSGILRSTSEKQSELVLPVWETISHSAAYEPSANFGALILAREGHKEALPWLVSMVQGGKTQGIGFRTLAGWYYARLSGQTDVLLKRVLETKN